MDFKLYINYVSILVIELGIWFGNKVLLWVNEVIYYYEV